MFLNILLIGVILGAVAMLFRDGLWSNGIALINTIIAGLIAVNYFEPVTRYFTGMVPYMDYNWDIMVLGALFGISYGALRYIGTQISPYQVRFHPLLDQIGGGLLALAAGWVAVCFLTFALHTAPMSRDFFGGGFVPEKPMFFGLAPDRRWLGFLDTQSTGSWGSNVVDEQGDVLTQFDPKGDYMLRYASRRSYLEKHTSPFVGNAPE